jgi:hypothetical protein
MELGCARVGLWLSQRSLYVQYGFSSGVSNLDLGHSLVLVGVIEWKFVRGDDRLDAPLSGSTLS